MAIPQDKKLQLSKLMITYYLILIFVDILLGLLTPVSYLPNATISPLILGAISQVGGYIAAIDSIFPVSALLSVIGLYVGVEAAIFTYKVIMWGIKKIPTIS
jgi:hypothetical protein